MGEPCGIGPEIVIRSLAKGIPHEVPMVIYGSPLLLEKAARDCGFRPFWNVSSTLETNDLIVVFPVGPNPLEGRFPTGETSLRAQATLCALDRASEDALSGRLSALITGPIDKTLVRTVLPEFTGHTEYLAQKAAGVSTVMMLDNTEIRVVLVTNHISLKEVSRSITRERLENVIRISAASLQKMFGIEQPRIALTGLNPHAGELVEGAEESEIFRPVVEKLSSQGWKIEGPFAADSFFALARYGGWDFIVSPYHDQGLVAAKYPGLDKVVNITLGLPYLRVSPGHGVAYDKVGQKRADARSFERALRIASTRSLVS